MQCPSVDVTRSVDVAKWTVWLTPERVNTYIYTYIAVIRITNAANLCVGFSNKDIYLIHIVETHCYVLIPKRVPLHQPASHQLMKVSMAKTFWTSFVQLLRHPARKSVQWRPLWYPLINEFPAYKHTGTGAVTAMILWRRMTALLVYIHNMRTCIHALYMHIVHLT